MLSIDLDERLPLFGQVLFGIDGLDGADRGTGPTVDAGHRVNIELLYFVELRLILTRMDAIYRTDLDAFAGLLADTRLRNDKSHELDLPPCENCSIPDHDDLAKLIGSMLH